MTTKKTLVRIAALLAVLASPPTLALAAQSSDDGWHGRFTVYGYFPEIGASLKLPNGADRTVSVDAGDLLDHLEIAFMGSLEVEKGPVGLFTDVLYMNVGGGRAMQRDLAAGGAPLPLGLRAKTHLDVEGFVWTLAGSYRVLTGSWISVDALGGARVVDLSGDLDLDVATTLGPLAGPKRSTSLDTHLSSLDGIVGVKGRVAPAGSAWFAQYLLDVGAGESDLTWQAVAGLGYSLGWVEILATWKSIHFDLGSDAPIRDLRFDGPTIGVALPW